ncbi:unnamed protein product [Gongylonema pulchrum]|uniref:Uncharacterized protein n=1 Tax=Gongylonema pulchrum TaxID=637853 RepID=A0A183CZF9_9BILA|nr:unnamed protein product [Gongylonema pulchrum]
MLVRRVSDENLDDCCCTVVHSGQIGVNKQTLSIQIQDYTQFGGATRIKTGACSDNRCGKGADNWNTVRHCCSDPEY